MDKKHPLFIMADIAGKAIELPEGYRAEGPHFGASLEATWFIKRQAGDVEVGAPLTVRLKDYTELGPKGLPDLVKEKVKAIEAQLFDFQPRTRVLTKPPQS